MMNKLYLTKVVGIVRMNMRDRKMVSLKQKKRKMLRIRGRGKMIEGKNEGDLKPLSTHLDTYCDML